MSQSTELSNQQGPITPFKAEECKEIADFYGVPQSIVNLFWVKLGGIAYPKAPFKMMQAQKKGVQRTELDLRVIKPGESYEVTARIYPKLSGRELDFLSTVTDPKERMTYFEYFTKPTENYGRANLDNVKMSTMHKFLPEMAVTRAVSRTCGIFAGVGGTSYEELPDAVLDKESIEDAQERIKNAKPINPKDAKLD